LTDYTKDAHALPFPEGGDKVAVHSDIQALATKAGIAISVEGARAEVAAKGYADTKDSSNRSAWAVADAAKLVEAKEYADATKAAAIADATNKYGGLPKRVTDVENRNTQQDTRLAGVENKNTQQDEKLLNHDSQLNGLKSALRTRGTLPEGDLFALTGFDDNGIYSLNSQATYVNSPFATSGSLIVVNDYQTPGMMIAQRDNTGDLWFSQNTTANGGAFSGWVRVATPSDVAALKTAIGTDIGTLADRGLLPMTGPDQYSMLWRDPSGRIAEPAAVDAYGNTPDWVLERWSERMADYLQADMGIKPRFAIAAQGDSMTERYQNIGGKSWTDVLAAELGVPVINLGKSGQSSTEVAVRVGGVPFRATVAGNTIPTSGAVGLTAYTPSTFWRTTLEHQYAGTLAGVPGILRQNVGDPVTFHFIRDEPGDAVACPPNSLFVPAQAKFLKWTPIIWIGRNNIGDGFVQQAIEDIDAIVDSLPFPKQAKRFLVFSVCNAQAEPKGSVGYARVMAINAHLESTHPDQYVDVRAWLRDHALKAMGLTPDAADIAAIAQDRIPPQLMQDNLHITEPAGQALGRYIVTVIGQKGILL
jgi:hypothetical protein